MLDLYQNAYRSMPSPLNPFGMVPNASRAAEPEPFPGAANHGEKLGEAHELRRRVEELEAMVAGLGMKKTPRKKRAKSRRKS